MSFDVSSRSRLGLRALPLFEGETLFARVARAVCRAECLPRKELYESWEVAKRVRRRFRGGRVVDLAAGHALIAYLMILLDDTSPSAIAVDSRVSETAPKIARELVAQWPRLGGRVELVQANLRDVTIHESDVVVSAHACGTLTDDVLDVATKARARVAVLPCCHDHATCDFGGLRGWLAPSLAIDATRAGTLRARGYKVRTESIPAEITEKNRLLLGEPT